MSESRSTFLGAVAQEAHSDWAAAEAQYRQELTDATGGIAAGPPTPPPAASFDAAAIKYLTPGWQTWATSTQSQLLKARGCG